MKPHSIHLGDRPLLASNAVRETIDRKSLVATAGGELLHFGTQADQDAMNPVSELALSLADGEHTLGQIVDAVVQAFDVAPDKAAEDLTEFFNDLMERGAYRANP